MNQNLSRNGINASIKIRRFKMEKIKTVWFDADRIYMKTQEGKVYSRPLEAYPDLKDASPEQRSDYVIGPKGDCPWRTDAAA